MPLSDKQRDVLQFAKEDGSFLLGVGAVRSGKTYGGSIGFAMYALSRPEPYQHMIIGRKIKMIENEIIPTIKHVAEKAGLKFRYNYANQIAHCNGHVIHAVAANDKTSIGRIQGLTIHSGLGDELTLMEEEFFNTAMTRLSYADSKFWGFCNPSYPKHWLKRRWIDQDKVDKCYEFNFADNPTLSSSVIERFEDQFSGVFRKRMIEGLWAAAEGVIYERFTLSKLNMSQYQVMRTRIGIDYGIASTTAFVAVQELRHNATKEKIIYIDRVMGINGEDGRLTDSELAKELNDFAQSYNYPTYIIDPSASSFIQELRKNRANVRAPKHAIRSAKNAVLIGIQVCTNMLVKNQLILSPHVTELIEEMNSYAWDEVKEDTPIKMNDHFCDAMRYAIMDYYKAPANENIRLPAGM